jgi:glutamine amidotransferase
MIVVIDYNVGNIQSVGNALRHLGYKEKFSRDPDDIEKAAGIILPGVAAFGYAVKELGKTSEVIKKVASQGKPLLGICVGFQMLFQSSTEMGEHKGLGLIKGKVVKIPPGHPIPHMGWNKVKIPENMDLFQGLKNEEYFYFAHSYHADDIEKEALVANTEYGINITASVQKNNIFGVQFHPEKSGTVGMKVLRNFEKICRKAANR